MTTPILILLAPGFEEIEFAAPLDILRRLGFEVLVAGVRNREVTSTRGMRIMADATLADLQADGRDANPLAVVLPGGLPGAHHLRDDVAVQALLKRADAGGSLIAAICAAPLALHQAGLLVGRRFTCYPSVASQIAEGIHTGARVERDGNIVTSQGAGTSLDFGFALGEFLGKGFDATGLRKSMIA